MSYTPAAQAQKQQQLAKQQATPKTAHEIVQSVASQIKLALPKHLSADRMIRIFVTEIQNNPKLLECNRQSLFSCILTCAQLGLEPGKELAQAYFIPRKLKGVLTCTYLTGYQGMIDIAERGGKVTIEAAVVHEKDEFWYQRGLNPDMVHKPYLGTDDPGPLVFAYAVARYTDGRSKFIVMTRREIDAVRASSPASSSGPWVTHYEQMARKTPIRQLFKDLPKSAEMMELILAEKEHETIEVEAHKISAKVIDPKQDETEGHVDESDVASDPGTDSADQETQPEL
jgi:recombination protein RecT